MVFVDGALWEATSEGGPVAVGERVAVIRLEGLRLWVRPVSPPLPRPAPSQSTASSVGVKTRP